MKVKTALRDALTEEQIKRLRRWRRPARWGILRQTSPVSANFAIDRGENIGRFYIGSFMDKHKGDISGHVMEVRDDRYASQFPDQITKLDILDLDPNLDGVTITADLAAMPEVPSNTFDCAIITQVFEVIWDFHAAIREIHRVLAPGGRVLASLSTNGRAWRTDDDEGPELWRFHPPAVSRLFRSAFGTENVELESFGNSLACIANLRGAAVEDVGTRRLFPYDPHYPMVTCVRATKSLVA